MKPVKQFTVIRTWLAKHGLACDVFLLFAVIMWLFRDVVFYGMPQSGDHPVHLTKSVLFWRHFFSTGSFFGWVPFLQTGYPVGLTYPIGIELLFGGVKAITFGTLSNPDTYALTFIVAKFFTILGVYFLGLVAFGRSVGLVAAIFFITDNGMAYQGGWIWSVYFGVWASEISHAFLLMLIASDLSGRKSSTNSLPVFLGALAVIFHPIALPTLLAYFVCKWVVFRPSGGLREIVTSGRVILLILGLSGFWLLPFLLHGDFVTAKGFEWHRSSEFFRLLIQNQLFGDFNHFLFILGFLAAGYFALEQKNRSATILSLLAFVVIAATFKEVTDNLKLVGLGSVVANIQFSRFADIIKAVLLILASAAVLAPFANKLIRSTGMAIAPGIVAMVFVGLFALGLLKSKESDLGVTTTPEAGIEYHAIKDFLQGDMRGRDLSSYNVGVVGHARITHTLTMLAADLPIGVYKASPLPAFHFINEPEGENLQTLSWARCYYVLSSADQQFSGYRRIRTIGPVAIHRILDVQTLSESMGKIAVDYDMLRIQSLESGGIAPVPYFSALIQQQEGIHLLPRTVDPVGKNYIAIEGSSREKVLSLHFERPDSVFFGAMITVLALTFMMFSMIPRRGKSVSGEASKHVQTVNRGVSQNEVESVNGDSHSGRAASFSLRENSQTLPCLA